MLKANIFNDFEANTYNFLCIERRFVLKYLEQMMKIQSHIVNNVTVYNVPEGEGSLAGFELDEFIDEIVKLKNDNISSLALNFSGKKYLNSTGLGELIKLKDSLLDNEINLVLISVCPRIKSLLNMVGVEDFFNIIEREEEL